MSSTGARYGIVSPRACCVPITRDIKLKPGFGKAARGRGKGASDVRVVEPSEAAIREAGRVLREAGLVAMPTETVYGLAGDATNGRAVASIYAAKGRPSFNPLIVHVESLDQASRLGTFSEAALQLARAFWPGPLTLVVPRRGDSGIADLVTAGLDSVAIRMPNHPVALALMAAAGRPLAAPSANRSGRLSPTWAEDVAAEFGDEVTMVLDGGACPHGIESTVVDATAKALPCCVRAPSRPKRSKRSPPSRSRGAAKSPRGQMRRANSKATTPRRRACG